MFKFATIGCVTARGCPVFATPVFGIVVNCRQLIINGAVCTYHPFKYDNHWVVSLQGTHEATQCGLIAASNPGITLDDCILNPYPNDPFVC